jgi:hypothetical protein
VGKLSEIVDLKVEERVTGMGKGVGDEREEQERM